MLVFKSESVWCVTVYIDAEFHSFDDRQALILRNRFGFLLSDCGEGIEQHLIAEGLSIDAFFLKDYADAENFSFLTYSKASFTFRANRDTDFVIMRSS